MEKKDILGDQFFNCKTAKDLAALYDNNAGKYDTALAGRGGNRFIVFGETFARHCQKKVIRILDLGAGTGLLGLEIKKLGFQNIDAHDGSKSMLEEARKKGIYKNFYHEVIDPDNCEPSLIPREAYDVVVGIGIIAPGHMNSDHLLLLLKPLKKGGLIMLAVMELFLTYPKNEYPDWKYEVGERMADMEADGIWKLIEKKTFLYYPQDKNRSSVNGVIFVYEKL